MQSLLVGNTLKYSEIIYKKEKELTKIFIENYHNIISKNSFWFQLEKQVKAKNFKNFKHSICDGFLLVWDNPTTPTLYLAEIELEIHDINRHILPQLGDFISFIQSASVEELNSLRNILYKELKNDKNTFLRIQKHTKKEVYELLDNAMLDLQILLVIDRISPELSIGLSQIEKAINVKIRKVEIKFFMNNKKEEVLLYEDSEEEEIKEELNSTQSEYTLEYHLDNKPDKIVEIVNEVLKYAKSKKLRVTPTKHYIGYFKQNVMIFSNVVRKNSVVFYSKANFKSVKHEGIETRDVKDIGHYTNHLPTEIVLTEIEQIKELVKYCDKVIAKY